MQGDMWAQVTTCEALTSYALLQHQTEAGGLNAMPTGDFAGRHEVVSIAVSHVPVSPG